MKNSLACPKCQSRKLWRIERFETGLPSGQPAPMRVVLRRASAQRDAAIVDHSTVGYVDAWICAACGYTELWSDDFEALRPAPHRGVHLVDTTPQQAPYR